MGGEGGRSSKGKNSKGKCEAKLEFPDGWGGGGGRNPFLEEVWIFKGP